MRLTEKQQYLYDRKWKPISDGRWRSPLYPHREYDEDYAYKFQKIIDDAFEEK